MPHLFLTVFQWLLLSPHLRMIFFVLMFNAAISLNPNTSGRCFPLTAGTMQGSNYHHCCCEGTKCDTTMWDWNGSFSSYVPVLFFFFFFFANSVCQSYHGATVCPACQCCQTCHSGTPRHRAPAAFNILMSEPAPIKPLVFTAVYSSSASLTAV